MSDRNQVAELSAEVKRVTAQRDEWQAVAEDRSRKYLEARGAWQIASDDREKLETERDALRDAAKMAREALTFFKLWHDDDCSKVKGIENDCDCHRVDVFKSLAALDTVLK